MVAVGGTFQVVLLLVVVTLLLYVVLYQNQHTVFKLLAIQHHTITTHHNDVPFKRPLLPRDPIFRHPNKNLKTYLPVETNPILRKGATSNTMHPLRKSSLKTTSRKVASRKMPLWNMTSQGVLQKNGTRGHTKNERSTGVKTLNLDTVNSMQDVVDFFKPKAIEVEAEDKEKDLDEEEKYEPRHIVDVLDEYGLSLKATVD